MSKDLNDCKFIGRLGKEVELRYMPSGKAIASFSIACNDDYKDKANNQNVQKTNWIPIVMFDRLAEIAGQYLKKGTQIFVSGKFTVRKWQDQSGQDRYTTEIVANEMQMLGGRAGGGMDDQGGYAPQQAVPQQAAPQSKPQAPAPQGMDQFDDDIPF